MTKRKTNPMRSPWRDQPHCMTKAARDSFERYKSNGERMKPEARKRVPAQ